MANWWDDEVRFETESDRFTREAGEASCREADLEVQRVFRATREAEAAQQARWRNS